MCRSLGILQESGRAQRSTFAVGGDGTIRHVWRDVKVDGHADEVLETVRSLQA